MNVFFNRYKEWLGEQYDGFLEEYDVPKCIRINTLKIKEGELLKRLKNKGVKLQKIDFLDFGYRILQSDFSLGASNEHLQGLFYMQEAASQYPVQLLEPKSSDLVLDMASAPGGKTTQIAQYMENKGAIVALDTMTKRLEALRNNCERLFVKNVIILNKDARYVSDIGLKFDKILLDAPCSGNYASDKSWTIKRKLIDFSEKAKVQKQLIDSAFSVLNDKGTLVYSTCSLEKEEDEDNVSYIESEYGAKILKVKKFWPHIDNTQGFFVCKVKKV